VYGDLRVNGELRVSSSTLPPIQGLSFVNADAPLSSPSAEGFGGVPEAEPLHRVRCDPSIASLARELVSGARTYREALARIADWVSSNIAYDESVSALPNYAELGALWALNARRGACLQFSRLFRGAGARCRHPR